jgi:energy-converting hydrogenase B subunit D
VTGVQLAALILVAITGTAVVLTPEALRQALVLGIFGLSLTVLFFTFQAPDVALSEIVVSTVGLPLIILLALRRIREQERSRAPEGGEGEE